MSDEWWEGNLAGIAWGGGIGKRESEQEARMYDMRAQGYSWGRACRTVYHDDTFTASMIARFKNVIRSRQTSMASGDDNIVGKGQSAISTNNRFRFFFLL
jgi:hypothetical protein